MGIYRATGAEPFLYNRKSDSVDHHAPLNGTVLVIFIGTFISILILWVVSLITQSTHLGGLNILLISSIFALSSLQDQGRLFLISLKKGTIAALVDLVALGVLTITIIFVYFSNIPFSLTTILGAWCLSTGSAALLAARLLTLRFSLQNARSWLQETKNLSKIYISDFLVTNGVSNGAILLVGLLGTPSASGALRGAQILLTPVLIVTRGLFVSLGPEFRRLSLANKNKQLKRLAMLFSLFSMIGAIVSLAVSYFVPVRYLQLLLGDAVQDSVAILPAAALAVAMTGVAMGAGLVLRVKDKAHIAFRVKLVSSPVSLLGTTLGTIIFGASGSQFGIALGELLRGTLGWHYSNKFTQVESSQRSSCEATE